MTSTAISSPKGIEYVQGTLTADKRYFKFYITVKSEKRRQIREINDRLNGITNHSNTTGKLW